MVILNILPIEKLEALGIKYQAWAIMELDNILSLSELLNSTQQKCILVDKEYQEFRNQFAPCRELGLPSPWTQQGKIFPFQSYEE